MTTPKTDAEVLKPCPFCKGNAWTDYWDNGDADCHTVTCACGAHVFGKTKDDAVRKWNARHIESAQAQGDDLLFRSITAHLNSLDSMISGCITGSLSMSEREFGGRLISMLRDEIKDISSLSKAAQKPAPLDGDLGEAISWVKDMIKSQRYDGIGYLETLIRHAEAAKKTQGETGVGDVKA